MTGSVRPVEVSVVVSDVDVSVGALSVVLSSPAGEMVASSEPEQAERRRRERRGSMGDLGLGRR